VRRYDTPEEASKRLVDYALSLGTMDNTTAVVVKLNWHLDFLTEDELNEPSPDHTRMTSPGVEEEPQERMRRDSVEDSESSPRIQNEDGVTEVLERVRSSTFAFRDSLNRVGDVTHPSLNHDVTNAHRSTTGMLRLQITIPRSSVIKLMHFERDMLVGEIFKLLIEKEKEDSDQIYPEDFLLFTKDKETKEDVAMDGEQKLSHYNLSDDDPIELRYMKEGEFKRSESKSVSRVATSEELQGATETKFFEQAINCFIWEQNHWRLLGDDRAKVTMFTVGEKHTQIRLCATAGEQMLLDMRFGLEASLQRDSETFYELRTPAKRVGFNFDKDEDAMSFNNLCLKEMVNISANSAT